MFSWKELLKRFHYAQYDERKLIRDLQLQVDDINAIFKSVDDYAYLNDAELADLTNRIVDLEAAGPFAPAIHNHDDRYYTESEVNSLLSGKSDTSHNHDSRYYTEAEIDSLLSAKLAITNFNNRPRFAAYGSGVGVGPAIWIPNTVTLNVGSAYSTVTGRFTCPVAGEYRIQYKGIEGSAAPNSAFSQLRKNGTGVSHSHSNYAGWSMQHHFYQGACAAGDYFDIQIQSGYSQGAASAQYNWFWGERTDF